LTTQPVPPRDCWISLAPKQSIEITQEVASDYSRQKDALRQIRGNIIAYSLDIEFAMDVSIRELLFFVEGDLKDEFKERIEKGRSTFDRAISKSGAVTFNNKIRILRTLLLENKIISEDDRKRLFKLLNEVREIRNTFAHTTIAFEPQKTADKTQLIPFIIDGGNRTYLDDKYFDKLNHQYSECLVRVENVTRTIQRIPLEQVPKATE
jgi:hypothetical protein